MLMVTPHRSPFETRKMDILPFDASPMAALTSLINLGLHPIEMGATS